MILNELKGIVRLPEQADGRPRIRCAAGESWHAFVMWTLAQGYGGLENLALIPVRSVLHLFKTLGLTGRGR